MILDLEDFKNKFIVLKNLGWIKTLRSGSTGIGYTLETLLNIPENNIGAPDFLDYELKAGRINSSSMLTLFTLAPQPARSNSYLRDKYGYISTEYENERKVLHTTLTTQRFSDVTQTKKLKLISSYDRLSISSDIEIENIYWDREHIKKAFDKKIKNKIMYIKAEAQGSGSDEHFLYKEAYIVSGFDFDSFMLLVESGKIFVDLRIGQYKNGKTHDHGTAFRIRAIDQILLFKHIDQII